MKKYEETATHTPINPIINLWSPKSASPKFWTCSYRNQIKLITSKQIAAFCDLNSPLINVCVLFGVDKKASPTKPNRHAVEIVKIYKFIVKDLTY
jgi:hypothetical protein